MFNLLFQFYDSISDLTYDLRFAVCNLTPSILLLSYFVNVCVVVPLLPWCHY